MRRARAGLKDPKRPIASFIFLGPTGVGKTELARKLAEALFDDPQSLIRLDMSEFREAHMVARLLGAPPGYKDSEEGGVLTEAIKRRPYSVVLLDEMEKAHPDVHNILLQLLEDGRLSDARGRLFDFTHCVVAMTTNVGGMLALRAKPGEDLEEPMREALLGSYRPELLNRVDEVIVFEPLTLESIEKLVELQVGKLSDRLEAGGGTQLKVSPEAQKFLAQRGFDLEFGARPLKRLLQRELEDVLAYKILDGTIHPGDQIEVRLNADQLTFHRVKSAEG